MRWPLHRGLSIQSLRCQGEQEKSQCMCTKPLTSIWIASIQFTLLHVEATLNRLLLEGYEPIRHGRGSVFAYGYIDH